MLADPKYLPPEMVYLYNHMTGCYDPGYVTEDIHLDDANDEWVYILDVFGTDIQMIGRERDMLSAQEYSERVTMN